MSRLIFILFAAGLAWGAAPPSKPYQDFISACVTAFDASSGTSENIGKTVCTCTSDESKHQGVSVAELKGETAEIRKDPSYKIKNKKLLAAFHYCTISLMEETEHAH